MEGIKQLQVIDYAVIAGYFIIIIGAGSYFSRYIRQARDYFTAGAEMSWWLGGISLWMATFSALGFVVYAELGYKFGLTIVTLYCLGIPAKIIGGMFFAKRWRRARQMSPIEFITNRFSASLKQVFLWTGFPLRILDNAVRLYATAVFLTVALSSTIFGMNSIIVLISLIIFGYSFLGGQWAVIVTDFVQFIIICLAVLIMLPLALRDVGGFSGFLSRVPDDFTQVLQAPYNLYYIVSWVLLTMFVHNAGWSFIQKYNCVKSDRDASKLIYFVALIQFLTPFLIFSPAVLARVSLPAIDNPRFAYAYMSFKLLPVGLMGVMIAAIFSATMSTLSNEYTMLSSVLTNDFYAQKIRPKASQKHLIAVARINSLLIGIVTALFAISFHYIRGMNLYDIMVKSFTAFAPAIMLPLLAGLMVPRVNSKGALSGIIAGFVSGAGLLVLNIVLVGIYNEQFLESTRVNYWLNQGWTSTSILVNVAVTVIGMWIGSAYSTTSEDERNRTDAFFRQLDIPYENEGITQPHSPFPVIGIIVAVMGAGMAVVAFAVRTIYNKPEWFAINGAAAAILLTIGGSLWFVSRRRNVV
ncbi:hypothetical protein ACFL47_03275 [Candidatus Latescibacterota bacterium]